MQSIAKPLLKWFDQHGRHTLPWQSNPANVYHVWLSEIMLQQTQVSTVIDYFNSFIQKFPTLPALANASEDEVLAQWAGLGYYARARNLHTCAKIIINTYRGDFPTDFDQVVGLPGIGESTAGAILSLSYDQHHAVLDGNVKRVLSRYHQVRGHYGQSKTLKELWYLARQYVPDTRNGDYTQAIMDLGATLCTRRNPRCACCPIKDDCQAQQYNTQAEYPNQKPKKNKPSRSIAMLIYQNEQRHIYLQKRPTKGIWGGLWSFIECDDNHQAISQTIQQFSPDAYIEKSLPAIKHSFTHYHLLINPIVINCPGGTKDFQALSELNIGLPTPVGKIVRQLQLD